VVDGLCVTKVWQKSNLTSCGHVTLITPIQEPSRVPTTWPFTEPLPSRPNTPLPPPPPLLPLLLLPSPAAAAAAAAAVAVGLSCSMLPLTVWSLAKVRVRKSPVWGQLTSRSPAKGDRVFRV